MFNSVFTFSQGLEKHLKKYLFRTLQSMYGTCLTDGKYAKAPEGREAEVGKVVIKIILAWGIGKTHDLF